MYRWFVYFCKGLCEEYCVCRLSSASSEQADGIEQINKALDEMDQVTQQNAAVSEESASASEELNAQAITMLESVDKLVVVVRGAETKADNLEGFYIGAGVKIVKNISGDVYYMKELLWRSGWDQANVFGLGLKGNF